MTCLLRVYVQSWIEIQAFINSYLEGPGTVPESAMSELDWTGEAS